MGYAKALDLPQIITSFAPVAIETGTRRVERSYRQSVIHDIAPTNVANDRDFVKELFAVVNEDEDDAPSTELQLEYELHKVNREVQQLVADLKIRGGLTQILRRAFSEWSAC